MTQFATLELLYNQFFNLVDEINSMIENEDYNSAILRLKDKDKLIKRLISAKKTANCTAEEEQQLLLIEKKLMDKEKSNIKHLEKLRDKAGEELTLTKKKVKINSAYDIPQERGHGVYLDISE